MTCHLFDQSFRIYSHATIALFTVAIVAQRVALQTQFKLKNALGVHFFDKLCNLFKDPYC